MDNTELVKIFQVDWLGSGKQNKPKK